MMDGTDRGAGLRVIFENRSVYGYRLIFSQSALEKLAVRFGGSHRPRSKKMGQEN